MRYREGREGILKIEHGILPGLKEVLLELAALEHVDAIVPGRIYATRGRPGGSLVVRVSARTPTGAKLIARRGSSVQEVFVVSSRPGDLEDALAPISSSPPGRAGHSRASGRGRAPRAPRARRAGPDDGDHRGRWG
ncbi:MAG TPA: DUF2103 domain-containing protein [Thermomicrobiaceae bacterium]|nr:DUF2103 domain-containing protein [Thermomicrobiaceae bacterium]